MTEQFAIFRASHILSDGTHVTVRALLPEDRPALESAFEHASPDTLRSRFLSEAFRPSPDMLRYLTEVDGWDHVALVATVDSLDLKQEVGVGVARFIRLADTPTTAEAAVTVDASMRRRGLAKLLLSTLAHLARERNIQHFRAYVLGDNEAVHAALGSHPGVRRYRDEDVWVYDLPIAELDDSADKEAGASGRTNPFTSVLRYVALATDRVLVLMRALSFRGLARDAGVGEAAAAPSADGEGAKPNDQQ